LPDLGFIVLVLFIFSRFSGYHDVDTCVPVEYNIPPLIPRLLPKLTEILSNYQQDPAIIVSLAIKLLKPLRFTDVLTLASEESLIRALESPAPTANILAMTIIEKAAKAPSDTAILSIMKGVVAAFLRTWLSSPSVEVGEKATKALGDLLEVDCDRASAANLNDHMNGLEISTQKQTGQGLLWRRIFHDRDICSLLYNLCVPHNTGTGEGQLDERQKSLAQARMLRILPKLATLDFTTVSRNDFPDIAAEYGIQRGELGLLYFAATQMISKEDMLMHITLIDFFAEFLDMLSMTQISGSTMEYLAHLTKTVAADDRAMYKSLESLATSPNSSPELVELLVKLNEYR
jgi:DNA mismatch repair protein HSM3, N terminal domain